MMIDNGKTNLRSFLTKALAVIGVGVLIVVLILAVFRTEDLRTFLNMPKAAGTSSSKLSAFFFSSGGVGATDIVNACPKVITVLDPDKNSGARQLITTYKTNCSGGKVVARIHTGIFDDYYDHKPADAYDPTTHQITASGIAHAQNSAEDYFNNRIRSRLAAMGNDISKIDYIEAPNEAEEVTDWSGSREANWLMYFYIRLADKYESFASNLGACPSIAVGDVGGDTDSGIAFKMDVTASMWQHVKSLGGAMCYHAYSYDVTKDANHERWLTFRYRIFAPHAAGIPVILSEAGAETAGGHNGGWKSKGLSAEQYESWLSWFDSEIKKDSYVLGASIYAYGSNDNYDISSIASWLANYIKNSGPGGGPPPPPPPPPPPGGGPPPPPPGGQPPPPPPGGQGAWIRQDDKSSSFDYGGNNPNHNNLPFWDVYNNQSLVGGSAHACRTDVSMGCRAKLTVDGMFNQVRIRALTGFNATSANIFVDGQKIGEDNAFVEGDGILVKTQDWTSQAFACGSHTVEIVPNGKTGRNAKSFTFDFVETQNCSQTTHPPSGVRCQGNAQAPAKCFSCKIDEPKDQVNIYDFSCFSAQYGKNVGIGNL